VVKIYDYWNSPKKRRNSVKSTPRKKISVLDLGFKPITSYSGNLWINEKHDSDLDGTPNYRDCNIFNPYQHGIIQSARDELMEERRQRAERKKEGRKIDEIIRKHKKEIPKTETVEEYIQKSAVEERLYKRATQRRAEIKKSKQKIVHRLAQEPDIPPRSMHRYIATHWAPSPSYMGEERRPTTPWTEEARGKPFKKEYTIKKRAPLRTPSRRLLKKDMSFREGVKFFGLTEMGGPFGDADKDGVPNVFDCRPFDSDKHFLKLSDLKGGIQKLGSRLKKQDEPTTSRFEKQYYLYVKDSSGVWSKIMIGSYFEIENRLDELKEKITDQFISEKPNLERRLNLGERVGKPLAKVGLGMARGITETYPKAISSYVKSRAPSWKKHVREEMAELGLAEKPLSRPPIRRIVERPIKGGGVIKEEYVDEDKKVEELMKELTSDEKQKEMMKLGYAFPKSEYTSGKVEPIEEIPEEPPAVPAERKGMPPYSRGWAGSIGGSRPYRPTPYHPTGQVIFREDRSVDPTPSIPVLKESPFGLHFVNPRQKRDDETMYMEL